MIFFGMGIFFFNFVCVCILIFVLVGDCLIFVDMGCGVFDNFVIVGF